MYNAESMNTHVLIERCIQSQYFDLHTVRIIDPYAKGTPLAYKELRVELRPLDRLPIVFHLHPDRGEDFLAALQTLMLQFAPKEDFEFGTG